MRVECHSRGCPRVTPSDLLASCTSPANPGTTCEAGWRPGNDYPIERVVGRVGSCGNGTCDFELGETSGNCTADCGCGDGFCDTSEVGSCPTDCAPGQPVMPSEWSATSACGDGVCQQSGVIPENCINCSLDCDAITDSDGDGTPDGCDLCAADPAKTEPGACGCGIADTDGDGDQLADCVDTCPLDPFNDADGDGVCGNIDLCPGTELPDEPTVELWGNRFAAKVDGTFDAGKGKFDGLYTLENTQGCSATQIIALEGLGQRHTQYGISKSALEAFIASLDG